MNVTNDKNETAIYRVQKNENAIKKVLRKRKLEGGNEYVSTERKLIPLKAFSATPCNYAAKDTETISNDKGERFFKHFYSLN